METWHNFKIYCIKTDTVCWYRQLTHERDPYFFERTHFFVTKIMENPFVVNQEMVSRKSEKKVEMRLYKHGEIIAKYFKQVGLI